MTLEDNGQWCNVVNINSKSRVTELLSIDILECDFYKHFIMQATLQLSQKIEDRNIRNGQLGILTTARQGNSTCSNVGCVNVVVPWQFYADFQTQHDPA